MAPTSIEKGRDSFSSDRDEEASLPLYATHNDETTLPLYNSQAGSSSSARETPSLPDKKATPQEVRDFLTELLVATRSLPVAEAQEIASSWKLGSGEELHGYPAQMYRQLFGSEYGWVVCKEVKTLFYEEQKKKEMSTLKASLVTAFFATLCVLCILAIATLKLNEALEIFLMVAMFMTGAVTFGMLVITLVSYTSSVEQSVNGDLRVSFFKEQSGGS